MRVLRLGNSADSDPAVSEERRIHVVAARVFTAETGLPVDHVLRIAWPSSELPGLMEAWLHRYEPDMVVFVVNGFWFNYQSVPLKLERTLGTWVRPLTSRARTVSGRARLGDSGAFRFFRGLALRTIGGATYFSPDEVLATTEACIKVVMARESIPIVLRGPLSPIGEGPGEGRKRSAEARRQTVHLRLEELCTRYHAQYVGRAAKMDGEEWGALGARDGLHMNADGQAQRGEAEGRGMVAAWRAGQGES